MRIDITANLLPKLLAQVEAEASDAVHATAVSLEGRARDRILTGSKTGHIYNTGPPPLPHQASAPGESPANWTGTLAGSILAQPTGLLEAQVQVGADYGLPLELGTVRMAPRPFLTPAAEEERPEFEARMAQIVEKAAR